MCQKPEEIYTLVTPKNGTFSINHTEKIIEYNDRHGVNIHLFYPEDWGMTRVYQRIQSIIEGPDIV